MRIITLYFWIKEHFCYIAGGGGGFLVGIVKYWNHFLDETLFKVIDACIVTLLTTIIGLIVVWVWKKIFK